MRNRIYFTGRLKEYRLAQQMSQDEMRSWLSINTSKNVALSTYQKWEQGSNSIAPQKLFEIARAIGIPAADLVEKRS